MNIICKSKAKTELQFALLVLAAGILIAIAPQINAQSTSPPPGYQSPGEFQDPNEDRIWIEKVFERQMDLEFLDRTDPEQRNYAVATAMAKCVVRRAKDEAGTYFGGPQTDDPKYRNLANLLTGKYRNCFESGASGIPMFDVNGALAEQILLKDFPEAFDATTMSGASDVEQFYLVDGKIASIDGLARCLAARSPRRVMAFLKEKPGSDEAQGRLVELYAGTPKCGVSDPVNISEVRHRGMLATGLYEWTMLK